ncbi:unnamed protein product [Boreogadus saida]
MSSWLGWTWDGNVPHVETQSRTWNLNSRRKRSRRQRLLLMLKLSWQNERCHPDAAEEPYCVLSWLCLMSSPTPPPQSSRPVSNNPSNEEAALHTVGARRPHQVWGSAGVRWGPGELLCGPMQGWQHRGIIHSAGGREGEQRTVCLPTRSSLTGSTGFYESTAELWSREGMSHTAWKQQTIDPVCAAGLNQTPPCEGKTPCRCVGRCRLL